MTSAERHHRALDPAALRVTYDRDRVLFARWHNVGIGIWGTHADARHADALARTIDDHVRECPEGISTISVVLPNVSLLPSGPERELTQRVVQDNAAHFIAIATVLLSTGFAAGAMRGFLTSLYFFQRSPYKFRIFSKLSDVATWVAPIHSERSGVQITAHTLDMVLQQVVAGASDR